MYVSIGSRSNVSDNAAEADRARIFEFNPDGTGRKVFAWGIRNAVGIAFRPGTNELWMSTNERDELGEDLVPDYISRVEPGGFYGWPWFYLGNHQDPRHKGKHPELAGKVLVPDVLVQSHSATLNLCFYDGKWQFAEEYRDDIFAAFHGSWNRARRTGYKIVRVPFDPKHRKSARRLRRFRDRLCHAGRKCLGPAGWNHGGERWQPALQRRRARDDLAGERQSLGTMERSVHTFDNGVRVYDDHLLEQQRERYKSATSTRPRRRIFSSISSAACRRMGASSMSARRSVITSSSRGSYPPV